MTPGDIKQIGALESPSVSDQSILLGNRFLSRRGSCLFAGRTGIGKSSATMQMALHFSVGRECFGIRPNCDRPLTSLIIQAENDDGDLSEMRDGILAAAPWEDCEREAAQMNVFTVTVSDAFGSAFCERLEHAARHVSADIVWIDPLFSFMGGDAMRQAEVSEFLRQGLQPILARNDFGLIVCHHENKPPRQDARTAWSDGDHAYAGSGSSELANWPRGVLVLSPVPDATGVFRLIGAKRGSRLGWRDHLGIPTTSRYLRHASDGTISWEEVAQPEVAKKTAPHTRDDFLAHVPEEGTIPKTTLIQKASSEGNRRKIGQTACRAYLDELIKEGVLYEHHEKRSGTNPMKLISRQPPPPIEAGNEDPEAPNTAQG